MEKSVAVYVRVSTEDQNPEGQIADLKRWIERNGIDPNAVEWITDRETGTRLARDGFKRLQAAVHDGRVRTIIVWKLDRISRKLIDGMNVVAGWAEKGVRVVSTTQQIDVSGVMGQMMANMLFGFAQIEHQYRAERQAAGIRVAKDGGVYTGRVKGTTKAKPDRARELRDVNKLAIEEIATALGCSIRTIHRYLATPATLP